MATVRPRAIELAGGVGAAAAPYRKLDGRLRGARRVLMMQGQSADCSYLLRPEGAIMFPGRTIADEGGQGEIEREREPWPKRGGGHARWRALRGLTRYMHGHNSIAVRGSSVELAEGRGGQLVLFHPRCLSALASARCRSCYVRSFCLLRLPADRG
eukprot:scaffold7217_cov362-Prasinococcus_capsulatus_cf.AAC.1